MTNTQSLIYFFLFFFNSSITLCRLLLTSKWRVPLELSSPGSDCQSFGRFTPDSERRSASEQLAVQRKALRFCILMASSHLQHFWLQNIRVPLFFFCSYIKEPQKKKILWSPETCFYWSMKYETWHCEDRNTFFEPTKWEHFFEVRTFWPGLLTTLR